MSEQPQTEAGRALWFDMTANSGGEALHPLWVEHLRGRIRAIEREAVAAWLASPEAVEELVTAMNDAYSYEDRDNTVPTLPFCDDLATFWEPFAAAILAALRDQRGAS